MFAATGDCCCPSAIEVTNVPGVEGTPGTNGAAGAAGISSFSFTQVNDIILPAVAGPVTSPAIVNFASAAWMAVGQVIFISDGTDWGHFEVLTLPIDGISATLEWLNYQGDSAGGSTIGINARAVASGTQPTFTSPLPVADGGTAGTTKATAQVGLGLGQALISDFDDALAYAITNAVAQITGIAVTATAAGLYKVEACITVLYTGVTFTNSLLTVRARNTTAAANLSEKTVGTNTHTILSFPALDYVIPPVTVTLALNDVVQLQCGLDVVESAGSSVVTDAWLSITPIALS